MVCLLGVIFLVVMCCKVLEKVYEHNCTTLTITWTYKIVDDGEKIVSSCESDNSSIIAAHFIKLYHNGRIDVPFVLM